MTDTLSLPTGKTGFSGLGDAGFVNAPLDPDLARLPNLNPIGPVLTPFQAPASKPFGGLVANGSLGLTGDVPSFVDLDGLSLTDRFAAGTQFEGTLQAAENALSVQNGALALDGDAALGAGLSTRELAVFQRSLTVTNSLILSGDLQLGAGAVLIGLNPLLASLTVINTTVKGKTFTLTVDPGFFGTKITLSTDLVDLIVKLLAAGSAAAAVAAALQTAGVITAPSAVVTGLISAIAALGAATLALLDFGNGICVYQTYFPPTFTPFPA